MKERNMHGIIHRKMREALLEIIGRQTIHEDVICRFEDVDEYIADLFDGWRSDGGDKAINDLLNFFL